MNSAIKQDEFHELMRQARADALTGRFVSAGRNWHELFASHPQERVAVMELVKIFDDCGARAEAEDILRAFVGAAPSHLNVLMAARQWQAWEAAPAPHAKTIRIALMGTGTLAPLGAHLRVVCAQAGLHPALYVSEFNQWAQDLLSPQSALYAFVPEVIILLLDAAALFPRTVRDMDASVAEVAAERETGMAQIAQVLAAARRQAPAATVILHTFAVPDYSPLGILDLSAEHGQRDRIQALNTTLTSLARTEYPSVVLFDQERIEARHGKARVKDDRLWYLASMPFSDTFLPVLASEYLRTIRPLKGLTRKCIVLDLDNTLWGGVIGEDGLNQIKLGGTSAPGNAFYEFQLALEGMRRRGVLLGLCTKNNEEDVLPVLEGHPHMILRRDRFAAVRINWRDKASNIIEIARELNIGLDSLVFFDDNPAERGLVRQQLPDVLTVELPRDPALYTRTLLTLDVFESLSLTEEDQRRSELYQEQQERKKFENEAATGDLSAYLRGLEMVVKIAQATPFTLPRIAQLINKTNQFNVTTRRYTEAQVQSMVEASNRWGVYSITVMDRFGDSGLTGVAIVRKEPETWEIDSFLLSCRVLGRGVEDALMAFVVHQAQAAGAMRLRGVFLRTAKNEPAADFFARQEFAPIAEDGGCGEASIWELPLDSAQAQKSYPDWLQVELDQPDNLAKN